MSRLNSKRTVYTCKHGALSLFTAIINQLSTCTCPLLRVEPSDEQAHSLGIVQRKKTLVQVLLQCRHAEGILKKKICHRRAMETNLFTLCLGIVMATASATNSSMGQSK